MKPNVDIADLQIDSTRWLKFIKSYSEVFERMFER